MIAWLEVAEAGTSGRTVGECLSLEASSDIHYLCVREGVLVLEDGMPHGALASIHRIGRVHVLYWMNSGASRPKSTNDSNTWRDGRYLNPHAGSTDPVVLQPSTSVSPLPGVTLRYFLGEDDAPRVSLGVAVDRWRDLLLFAPNDIAGQAWRCVPCTEPAAPPRRLVFLTRDENLHDEWPLDAFAQACQAPPCATRVLEDHERENVLITEDTAGVTFDDIVEASVGQGALLDPSMLYAILGPVARVLGSTPLPADADPWNIHVTFDGRVCFDGFVAPWLPIASAASLSLAELAEDFVLGGLLGPPVPRLDVTPFDIDDDSSHRVRAHRLEILGERAEAMSADLGRIIVQILDGNRAPVDRHVLADAVERWGETLPPAPPGAIVALLRGLFPARVAAEEQLREQLAMLDGAGVAALLSEKT